MIARLDLALSADLVCFFSPRRAPMLVYVRPSNEALLRARVPGAQDQYGCPSHTLASPLSATYNAPVLFNLSFNCLEEP